MISPDAAVPGRLGCSFAGAAGTTPVQAEARYRCHAELPLQLQAAPAAVAAAAAGLTAN
jgi:hypothetical protein